jgi:nucleotide-binding universal stress UspA family protein
VVVIRGRDDAVGRPVVVGADGSAGSEAALSVAFDVAAAWHAPLVAVRAYHLGERELLDDRCAEEYALLNQQVAPWQDKYPGVVVRPLAVVGHAAQALTDTARTAELVVVGTRGHHEVAGLLTGSIGLHLLHHSDVPVLIARGDRTPAG